MIKEIGEAKFGKEKGFTLVELLVVIAIVAILAIVSVAGYTQFIANARENNVVNELTQLRDMFVDNDVNDSSYFIADDGIIYQASVKDDRLHDDATYTLYGAANGTGEATLIKSEVLSTTNSKEKSGDKVIGSEFQELVKKLFPDMLESKDGEVRLVSLSNDGKQVIYTYQYDDKVIFATWDVATGTIESMTMNANDTSTGNSNVATVFEYLMTGQNAGSHEAGATMCSTHKTSEVNGVHGVLADVTYSKDAAATCKDLTATSVNCKFTKATN